MEPIINNKATRELTKLEIEFIRKIDRILNHKVFSVLQIISIITFISTIPYILS